MAKAPRWDTAPTDKDYVAAEHYLSLVTDTTRAAALATRLREGAIVAYRANDLLRASGLDLLASTDPEVIKDLKKIDKGIKLAPVLVVRGDLETAAGRLTVADGYHRICASYHLDPDNMIPCQIIDLRS